jgi:thiol-disulfide isomerase/thioredoxin
MRSTTTFNAILLTAVLIVTAACNDSTPVRAYEIRGVVTEIPEDHETIVLSHDEIANFMPAMVMPFTLAHPAVAAGVAVGDEVLFQIIVTASGSSSIVSIEKVSPFSGPFPEFELMAPDGELIPSSVMDGKVGIVNFWASWCAPCREEMPSLVRLQAEYEDQGLAVIGIAEDPENLEDILAQVEELDVNYPIVMGDGDLEEAVGGVFQIPTTFILGRDGTVSKKYLGIVPEDELRAAVLALL